ncbi:hypothetical protein TWF730_009855 [Orbilia blumenaviensis]|uniref:Zinc finger Mcm10/DnaG-type domain-containing protein n=1 Tax=Orbilia blumenaviensis TaxID=1796055 RepID=A0AAV9USY3_9PEZI
MAGNNGAVAQWPPASPKDVLRLTPKKPHTNPIHSSPLRRTTAVSPSPRSRRPLPPGHNDDDDEDEDSDATTSEEDEEALQLQLKAIEMKLKLKRLQKEKKRKALAAAANAPSSSSTIPRTSNTGGRVTPPPSIPPTFESTAPDVQVPVSPSPRRRNNMPISDANPPQSPSRVLLGIDKGLRARDISLKRAPGMTNLIAEQPPRKPQFASSSTSSTASALHNVTKDNPFAPRSSRAAASAAAAAAAPVEHVKSFSERIAEQRAGITAKEARARENEKLRSKGWNMDSNDNATVSSMDSNTLVASRASSVTSHRPASSQQQQQQMGSTRLQTSRITSSTASASTAALPALPDVPKPTGPSSISGPADPASGSQEPSDLGSGFDSFSSLHLSRRTIPHTTLSRHLQEKELFQLPRLLKTVHSPEYDPPDVPGDWVVFGIVSSKSEPRDVAREGGGKYIVMQLTDLKWEIDLFFFGATFQKYYRIPVGTVLAILNPNIMKPRNQDSGKFSLTLSDGNDEESSILEIGQSRDLAGCKARKRDGKECGVWVDKRRTEYCDFHVEQTVAKNRAGRMELNTMGKLYSPPKNKGGIRPKRNWLRGGKQEKEDGLLPLGGVGVVPDLPVRAGGGGGNVYVSSGFSTARLIDGGEKTGDLNWQREKEERVRRVLARREKEREVTRGLLAVGNSNTGMEYLKANLEDEGKTVVGGARAMENAGKSVGKGQTVQEVRSKALEEFRKGMMAVKASDVSLSPVKSKRKVADRKSGSPEDTNTASGGKGGQSATDDERAVKRTRKTDEGPVGWAQRDVKKHLDRNVALTSAGGYKQTQLGFGRARSRSPPKNIAAAAGGSDIGAFEVEQRVEREMSPTKSNMVMAGRPRRDSKTVTFAPTPDRGGAAAVVGDDDSDDELEILGM